MRQLRLLVFTVGALALSGCHTYTAVDTPAPGSTVRLRLPITSAADDPNAAPQTVSVEGEVLSAGDTIVLARRTTQEINQFRSITQFDTIRVARDQTSDISVRAFSQGRTVVLGAAITGAVVGLAFAALGIEGGQAGDGPPTDGTNPQGAVISRTLIQSLWKLIGG